MDSSLYIGLMSGTSLDGIDAVLVELGEARPRLLASHYQPLTSTLRAQLLALCQRGDDEIERLGQADIAFAEHSAAAVRTLLRQAGVSASAVAAIGSHGQTIRHRPSCAPPFTLQIGDPNTLAERTGITTVADFRRRDIAAGGQGAPLVPAFHQAVFAHPERCRIIANIGGFANISVLPPAASGHPVRGYDTGPGNVLLDTWIQHNRQQPYDRDGAWAASGQPIAELLQRLQQDPFFHQPPPKSTGREHFNWPWLEARLDGYHHYPAQDIQATLVELTAASLGQAITQEMNAGEVFVCGGGAHNTYLLQRLRSQLPDYSLGTTDSLGVPVNWVEAIAFAWLAQQTLRGSPGNAPAVTGARGPRILGGIYQA